MNVERLKILATEYKVEEVEQIDKYQRLLGQNFLNWNIFFLCMR